MIAYRDGKVNTFSRFIQTNPLKEIGGGGGGEVCNQ